VSGLELYDDEPTIFFSEPNHNNSNHHQVYAILKETSEELDANNNPVINPRNLGRGAKHVGEGEIEATVITREKVRLTATQWETIKIAFNHGRVIPLDAPREVLMGYQYTLHRQGRRMLQEREYIRAWRESASAASRALTEERSNTSYTNNGRHHMHGSRVDNLDHGERQNLAWNLESSFLSVDEQGNIVPKMPEAAHVRAQAYLLTTQPTPGDPREGMHRAALKGLGLVGNRLQCREEAP
jgi:hypothetical protein